MKVLMLIDSLGIGGAETHVETLAIELRKLGCEVAVASFGGAIAERLQKMGIRHLQLPDISPSCSQNGEIKGAFWKSRPRFFRLISACKSVFRFIKEEDPNIVHAHTRTTSFIAKYACRRRGVPLIMTVHAMFSMKFPKNMLSHFGDGAIAVSEDIKELLISRSLIPAENLRVIENGVRIPEINKREQKNAPGRNENKAPLFSSPASRRTVVFVSRLDADCSLGAYLLCEIATELASRYEDIEIIIAGGGAEFGKISSKAHKINGMINRRLINAIGRTDEPSAFYKDAAVFVGVSRAALEAMACSVPVILLGDEGCLGVLDKGTLERARRTNLTCRGSRKGNAEGLLRDICRIFDMSAKEREELGEFCRRVAKKYYSAETMARRTLDFYREISDR